MSRVEVEAKELCWIDPKDAEIVFDCFTLKIECP